jgi:hypothetical protein
MRKRLTQGVSLPQVLGEEVGGRTRTRSSFSNVPTAATSEARAPRAACAWEHRQAAHEIAESRTGSGSVAGMRRESSVVCRT